MSFLSVDIGGTRIKWGLIDGTRILRRGVLDTPAGDPAALLDTLEQLFAQADAAQWALAVTGEVAGDGVLTRAPNLGVAEPLALADELEARCAVRPAAVVNDLTAACAGEASGPDPQVLLFFGAGIGSKVSVGGQVLRGAHGRAGEVGHLCFRAGGRACPCGGHGCAEAYAGWGGLRRAYTDQAQVRLNGPAELLERAQDGDDVAADLIEDALDAAGFAAAALVSVHDPQVLRVGGGTAAAFGDLYVEAVRIGVSERCWMGGQIDIQPAVHGDDAPLLGLHHLAVQP